MVVDMMAFAGRGSGQDRVQHARVANRVATT